MAIKKDKLTTFDQAHPPVLGTRHGSFQSAYATVASLRMQVQEGTGFPGVIKNTYTLDEHSWRDTLDCSNPLCKGGGVYLRRVLAEAVDKKEPTINTSKVCEGAEATRRCDHTFYIEAAITYKSETAAPTNPGHGHYQ